jgi:hypothetical protein
MRSLEFPMNIKAIVGLAVLAALPSAASAAEPPARPFFSPVLAHGPAVRDDDTGVVRSMHARLDLAQLQDAAPLRLALPGAPELQALADRVESRPDGLTWSGHVADEGAGASPDTHVVFAVQNGVAAGTVAWRGRTWSLAYEGDGVYAVQEIDARAFSEVDDFIEVPPAAAPAPEAPLADDGSVIDLMVVYTAAAAASAGGTDAMLARIALGVAETNQGYVNSRIRTRLRLVHAEQVDYAESGNSSTDLSRLRAPGDGFMDNVHALRDTYGADMVKLVVANGGGACGVAYLMGGVNPGFGPNAFSVTAQSCISPNYTFGHELGHNMGSNHAREDPTGTGAFAYSFGYKHPNALFRTVMSYACTNGNCPRVLWFSNPDVRYRCLPAGIVNTAPDSADNARSINGTRTTVANWRASVVPAQLFITSVTPSSAPAAGGTTITVTGTGFPPLVSVFLGTVAASNVVVTGSTQITATLPPLPAGALHDVSVVTPLPNQHFTLARALLSDFTDVPAAHTFHGVVERLARFGVTSGCGGGNYCPSSDVTRAQMAVFLIRSQGANCVPPAPTGTLFQDVPQNGFAAAYIEKLAADGVTGGCQAAPPLYCPDNPATRAQMAVFLLRSKYGPTYTPPPPTGTVFQDVPANGFAAAYIEQLVREGVTSGCQAAPPLYCPDNSVLRDQMAAFLVTTFVLP